MNEAELQRLRRKLLDLKAVLQAVEHVAQDAGSPVELDQGRIGRLSRMDAMQAQEMAQETARRRERKLGEINGALRRLESSEYGYCFVCGEEIGVRRLEADPANTRCIKCAERG
jgi:DnaK suppressor protein